MDKEWTSHVNRKTKKLLTIHGALLPREGERTITDLDILLGIFLCPSFVLVSLEGVTERRTSGLPLKNVSEL